jgi:hypothetical protein
VEYGNRVKWTKAAAVVDERGARIQTSHAPAAVLLEGTTQLFWVGEVDTDP